MTTEQVDAGRPDRIAGRLEARFEQLHGRAPIGVFAAPGRVNLIGEHVDYNGGRCLPVALPHSTYAAVAPRDDERVSVHSVQEAEPWAGRLDALGPEQVSGWPAYVAGVAWALQEAGIGLPGMDVVVDGRVPVGAGLSSSAALECSVALGLCALAGREVDDELRHLLVQVCMRAELEVAGAPTGGMDQAISLFGRADHALLLDCRDWSMRQVPWDPAADGLELLVVDTKASHALVDGGYGARRSDCEKAARILGVRLLRDVEDPRSALARLEDPRLHRRARHVFTEMARVDAVVARLEQGDLAGLGPILTASHESLRDDYEVSAPELDEVVTAALHHGALGARMTGGGFGGSAIVLLPGDRVAEVEGAVRGAFERHGWSAPAFLLGRASDGARRIA